LPTIALNDGRKLRALGERHTHAVDANVGDLVAPVAYGEPSINFNQRSLRTNDLAGHDHASGIGPALAVGIPRMGETTGSSVIYSRTMTIRVSTPISGLTNGALGVGVKLGS
jgi:hypothetical protein